MAIQRAGLGLLAGVAFVLAGCAQEPRQPPVELASYPITGMDGVLTQSGVAFDADVSSDGNGALRIEATEPTTVRLFETGDLDVEGALLTYRARVRTQDLDGRAYLEMWCQFPGQGEFFSRALHAPLLGTIDWATQETPFVLQPGENPENVRLNLVIEGTGTAWVDDVRLMKGSL